MYWLKLYRKERNFEQVTQNCLTTSIAILSSDHFSHQIHPDVNYYPKVTVVLYIIASSFEFGFKLLNVLKLMKN